MVKRTGCVRIHAIEALQDFLDTGLAFGGVFWAGDAVLYSQTAIIEHGRKTAFIAVLPFA